MTKTITTALSAVALLGCGGSSFELDAPTSFVTFDDDDERFAQRSTSARGVVVAVRDVDNDPRGPLEFWVEAIRDRMRRAGGYALQSESQVRAATGQVGHQMRFGRDEGSRPYLYWVTVFVTADRIYLVEAGGQKARFEEVQSEIENAIRSMRL